MREEELKAEEMTVLSACPTHQSPFQLEFSFPIILIPEDASLPNFHYHQSRVATSTATSPNNQTAVKRVYIYHMF